MLCSPFALHAQYSSAQHHISHHTTPPLFGSDCEYTWRRHRPSFRVHQIGAALLPLGLVMVPAQAYRLQEERCAEAEKKANGLLRREDAPERARRRPRVVRDKTREDLPLSAPLLASNTAVSFN